MFDSSNFNTKISNSFKNNDAAAIDKLDGFTQTKNQRLNDKTSLNFLQHCSGIGHDDNCCLPLHTNLTSAATTNFYKSTSHNDFSSPTHSSHQVFKNNYFNNFFN